MTDQEILKDVLEVVDFIKDQMVTRDEFTARLDQMVTRDEFTARLDQMVTRDEFTARLDQMVTRDEFNNFKSEIISHIDGFLVLHQKLDTELAALRAKYDRLESFVYQLAKQANVSLQD